MPKNVAISHAGWDLRTVGVVEAAISLESIIFRSFPGGLSDGLL